MIRRIIRRFRNASLVFLITAFTGCLPLGPVQIDRLIPSVVEPGDLLRIQGRGFGNGGPDGHIYFGDTELAEENVLDWRFDRIDLRLPQELTDCEVWIQLDTQVCQPVPLTVVPEGTLHARILAFGDSLTWGQDGVLGSYVSLLERILLLAGVPCSVINEGLTGETTPQGQLRLPSVMQHWEYLDLMLLLEGTNDVSDGTSIRLEDTLQSIREMIRLARDDHDVSSILATPPPRLWGASDYNDPTTIQLVDALRSLSVEELTPLADLYDAFLSVPDLAILYTDSIHPNALGYYLMAETWQIRLQATPFLQ